MKATTSKLIYTRPVHQIKEIATSKDTMKSRHLVKRLYFLKKRINLPK